MKIQMMLKPHLSQHPSQKQISRRVAYSLPSKRRYKSFMTSIFIFKRGILITIQTTDGLFVKKGGLDYAGMKDLVSRLEGLC